MSKDDTFVDLLSRHFVPLCFEYQTFNEGKLFHEGINALSGFIIELHGVWYWTTAGHCFAEIDDLIKSGRMKIKNCWLADYFGMGAKHWHGVPIGYEAGTHTRLHNKSLGLDYGFIPLPNLIKMNLKKIKSSQYPKQTGST